MPEISLALRDRLERGLLLFAEGVDVPALISCGSLVSAFELVGEGIELALHTAFCNGESGTCTACGSCKNALQRALRDGSASAPRLSLAGGADFGNFDGLREHFQLLGPILRPTRWLRYGRMGR